MTVFEFESCQTYAMNCFGKSSVTDLNVSPKYLSNKFCQEAN